MKKLKPNYIYYKSFKEKSGSLIPFYIHKSFPKFFKLKRFFFVYGKKKYLRADHAHKKCSQIIIPVKGTAKITTYYKKKKKIFFLKTSKNKALFIPIHTWLNIKFYKDNDSILTLCNYLYNKKEYILNFSEFKKKYY